MNTNICLIQVNRYYSNADQFNELDKNIKIHFFKKRNRRLTDFAILFMQHWGFVYQRQTGASVIITEVERFRIQRSRLKNTQPAPIKGVQHLYVINAFSPNG